MKTVEEIQASGRIVIDMQNDDGFRALVQFPHWQGSLIVSWGGGWEHASVSPSRRNCMPTWDDMCFLKNLVWNEDEAVIQVHPPKAESPIAVTFFGMVTSVSNAHPSKALLPITVTLSGIVIVVSAVKPAKEEALISSSPGRIVTS